MLSFKTPIKLPQIWMQDLCYFKTVDFTVKWSQLVDKITPSLIIIPYFDKIYSAVSELSASLHYQPRCHFSLDPKDNSLRLFNYENKKGVLGYLFFFHFFLVWFISFLGTPFFIYSIFAGHRWFILFYGALVVFTYSPIPRHFEPFRLWIFLEVPKYFKSASYRVLSPEKWPELENILSMLKGQDGNRTDSGVTSAQVPSARSWHVSNLVRQISKVKVPPRIWIFHPHGVLATGWGLQAFNPYFETRDCVATALYLSPLIICYTSMLGNPASVRAADLKRHLKNGKSISIITGGFEEATLHPNRGDRLYLKARKGIFKYALVYGAELVPVFTFGETKAYSNAQGNWSFRLWLNSWSIPAMLPHGRKFLFWMPKPELCHVVVGTPIPVEQNRDPSSSQITALQQLYIKRLVEMYDKYKKRFYGPDYNLDLELWDY